MEELKIYKEWLPILESENGVKIIDDDGGRALSSEGRLDTPITKAEATNYFLRCTVSFNHITKGMK